jgi:hypothetical protein
LRNPWAIHREDVGSSIFRDMLKDLLSFLHRKTEGEATISVVKAGFKLRGDVSWKENQNKQVEMAVTTTGLFSGENKRNSAGCLFVTIR